MQTGGENYFGMPVVAGGRGFVRLKDGVLLAAEIKMTTNDDFFAPGGRRIHLISIS